MYSEYISSTSLAERLHVSRLTIIRAADRLGIAALRVFQKRLFSADEADRIAADRRRRETLRSTAIDSATEDRS